jgi:hypothetical protein
MARRHLLAALALLLAVAGCHRGGGRSTGQPVQVVAGGGDATTGPAADARIDGGVVDLAVDDGGTVRVLTDAPGGLSLWTAPAGGELTRVAVRGVHARGVSQLAVGPGGAVYLAAAGSVWRLGQDGAATRVVGLHGAGGPAPDGTPAAQARTFAITGVALAGDGTLYYAEVVADPVSQILVRTVRDGRVRTVLGRIPARTASESDVNAAAARSADPPPGTRATDLVLGGVQARLAAGAGGTLYLGRDSGVLALRADGTAAAVIAGRAPQAVRPPTAPFEPVGDAAAALPHLVLFDGRVSLGADPASGDLYLVTQVEGDPHGPAAAFRWRGSFPDAQQRLVARQRANVAVWRVDGQGRLAVAASGADAVAARGGWLYLAATLPQRPSGGGDPGSYRVLVLRTAVPR